MIGYNTFEINTVSRAQVINLEDRVAEINEETFALTHKVDNLHELFTLLNKKIEILHNLTGHYNFNFEYQYKKIEKLEKDNQKLKGLLASVSKATLRGFQQINEGGEVSEREVTQLEKAFKALKIN